MHVEAEAVPGRWAGIQGRMGVVSVSGPPKHATCIYLLLVLVLFQNALLLLYHMSQKSVCSLHLRVVQVTHDISASEYPRRALSRTIPILAAKIQVGGTVKYLSSDFQTNVAQGFLSHPQGSGVIMAQSQNDDHSSPSPSSSPTLSSSSSSSPSSSMRF